MNITESEKKRILSLYEQKTEEVLATKIDSKAISILPQDIINNINEKFNKIPEIKNEIKNDDILSFLVSKGMNPYLFIVPNMITGEGFPTLGVNLNLKGLPINFDINLGTNPMDVLSSLKFSRVNLRIPF
jgi:hypothetical protein